MNYKELTEEKAIDISIELWTWLTETGSDDKLNWPDWGKYIKKDGRLFIHGCPLCQFATNQRVNRWATNYDFIFDFFENGMHETSCKYCPYHKMFGICDADGKFYTLWSDTEDEEIEKRKKYATKFLKLLKSLKRG